MDRAASNDSGFFTRSFTAVSNVPVCDQGENRYLFIQDLNVNDIDSFD
jgi:hypothetical protein